MKYDNFLVIIKSEHGHKDSETYEELRRVNCGNFLCMYRAVNLLNQALFCK